MRGEDDRIRSEVHEEYIETLQQGTLVELPGTGHDVAGSPLYRDLLRAFFGGGPLPGPATGGGAW